MVRTNICPFCGGKKSSGSKKCMKCQMKGKLKGKLSYSRSIKHDSR